MYNKIRTHPGPLIPDIVKSFSKSIKFLERSYVPTDSLIQSHQSNYFAMDKLGHFPTIISIIP